jgi:hypothetical protein
MDEVIDLVAAVFVLMFSSRRDNPGWMEIICPSNFC